MEQIDDHAGQRELRITWQKFPRWKWGSLSTITSALTLPNVVSGLCLGVPICGANIDNRALANVLQRVMIRDGRLMRLVFDIPDRPGILGEISSRIGAAGANIIEVSHHRLFTSPSVQAARLEVMFEARDAAHSDAVLTALQQHYAVSKL